MKRKAKAAMSPEEVKAIRTQFGMTLAEFAAELGVDMMTLSRWERGSSVTEGKTWVVTKPMAKLLTLLVENKKMKAQLERLKARV